MKRTGHGHAKGHTGKHSGTHKHHAHGAKHHPTRQSAHHHAAHHQHHVHTKAHHQRHARGLAIGDALPVCTFEALAMSLRLAGHRVSDDDVLELWWLSGADEDGASIAAALAAAAEFGLAGIRPAGYREITPGTAFPPRKGRLHCSILGVDLPGPHAVTAVPGGWLSWGALYDPWPARIEEAWAVTWA